MSDTLLIEKSGRIATVTMNRPDRMNAWNGEMKDAMRRAVGHLNDDPDIAVVILKGSGRGFSAGADISGEMADPLSFHLDIDYKPFLTGIERSDKIWISQVHGAAAGVGAAISMICDLTVMADDAYHYLAFAAIALVPDGGNTWLLARNMGYKRALQAALEGRKIPAAECLELGLANKVVPAAELEAETRAWAEKIASGAPLALSAVKRLMRRSSEISFGEAVTEEGIEQTPLLKSEDFREGVRAFFAKEKPAFKGR